jgi:hypothetical protein
VGAEIYIRVCAHRGRRRRNRSASDVVARRVQFWSAERLQSEVSAQRKDTSQLGTFPLLQLSLPMVATLNHELLVQAY